VPGDSLKQSMDNAVKRYSSLFRLPTGSTVFLLLLLFCAGGGFLSTVILFPSPEGLSAGLLFGLALFLAVLVADLVINTFVLKRGGIFDLRRTLALSLFCWGFWLVFIFGGVLLAVATSDLIWWLRLCLLGFSAVLILRLTTLTALSSMGYKRIFAASFFPPFLSVVPFVLLWTRTSHPIAFNAVNVGFFFLFSPVIGFVASFSFLLALNRMGKRTLGVQSMSLFRAFMLNWVLGLNMPFEELLEKLGEQRNVDVALMSFRSSNSKAIVVVPSVHPGPFKNIGSSLLPSMLKADLEKQLGCVACVPHGLLGHEFDLASQSQNKRVVADVIAALQNLELSGATASPFVTVTNGLATACCQVYGKFVFISFTLAPRTIEDLPQELGVFVGREAERHGLKLCAVVNAHNSIDGTAEMERSLSSLEDVAVRCMGKAVSLKQLPFEVGVATRLPKEFSLEEGMGPGGITVVVARTGGQSAAYVVIDGNNMVAGLRERILSELRLIGVDEGEVLTTDTHAVSALILSGHGYHPIGEAMDNEKLVGYIKETTLSAMARLEKAAVSCQNITVSDVKVIGAKQLEGLCSLVDMGLRRAKRVVVPIFGASGLLLILLLMFA
jgi:putative membrane protein